MNFALSALVLFVLLSPGYFASRAYFGRLGRESTSDPAVEDGIPITWLRAFILAPFLHCVGIFVLWILDAPLPDFEFILQTLAGEPPADAKRGYASISNHPYAILAYFSLLNVSSTLLGQSLNRFVRSRKLDIKYLAFRFDNDWHYAFTGELLSTPPSLVIVDATIPFDGDAYIYTGALLNWKLGEAGKLERLHLGQVIRRKLDSNEIEEIPGDDFIVWCENINTLNLRYVTVTASPKRTRP